MRGIGEVHMGQTVQVEVADKVATVTLNRPDKLNAQDLAMRQDLVEALGEVGRSPDVWVAIITGAGRAFSTGHDLKEELAPAQRAVDPGSSGVYSALLSCPKPIIAAINGPCLAQGAGVALLCDIRLAAEGTELAWPQVHRGIASVSGPALLARALPRNIALEHMFTGKPITPEAALRWGLFNRIVPAADVLQTAQEFAHEINRGAPLAVQAMKGATRLVSEVPQHEAFEVAESIVELLMHSEDAKEGLRAFAEKRTPVWRSA